MHDWNEKLYAHQVIVDSEGSIVFSDNKIDGSAKPCSSLFDFIPSEYVELLRQKLDDALQRAHSTQLIYPIDSQNQRLQLLRINPLFGSNDRLLLVQRSELYHPSVSKDSDGYVSFNQKDVSHSLFKEHALIILDAKTYKILHADSATAGLLGYAADELEHMYFHDILTEHPDLNVEHRNELYFEGHLKRKDNSFFYAALTILKFEVTAAYSFCAVRIIDVAEQEKKTQRERFMQFSLDNCKVSSFWMNRDGTIFCVNEQACNALGYDVGELIHKSVFDIDPVFTRHDWEVFWSDFKSKKRVVLESVHKRKDGTTFPVEILATYFNYEGVEYNFSFAQDITNRKNSQRELERFKMIADNAGFGMIVIDTHGIIRYINNYYALATGYEVSELIGQNIDMLYAPNPAYSFVDFIKQLAEMNMYVTHEVWHNSRDGKVFPMLMNGLVIRHENEAVLYAATGIDITPQKNIENELKKKHAILNSIIGASPLAIVVVDAHGKVILWSPAAERMFGWKAEEVLGGPLPYLPEEDVAKMKFELHHVFKGNSSILEQRRRLCKDGTAIDVTISTAALYDGSNKVIGAMAVIADVSEQKKIEGERELLLKQFAQKNAELEKANKELDEFIRIASHDLRAPIITIRSFAELLQKSEIGALDAKGCSMIERIRNGAIRMDNLLEDLLLLTRMTRQQRPYERIKIKDMLDDLICTYAEQPNAPERERLFTVSENIPDICGDPIKIKELFANLISNAVKYSSKNDYQKIEIGYIDKDDKHLFVVADNGIGIKPLYHEKIFDSFIRLHSHDEYSGTGIGLNIVKRIVEEHGGAVWVESEEGKGAKFFVTIPKKLTNNTTSVHA